MAELHFGPFPIDRAYVFYETELSFAFTNLNPVVPGHVLVSPKRVIQYLDDLEPPEKEDLFTAAEYVSRTLKKFYAPTGVRYVVNNGKESGQTVPHVHIHILPTENGITGFEAAMADDSVRRELTQTFRSLFVEDSC